MYLKWILLQLMRSLGITFPTFFTKQKCICKKKIENVITQSDSFIFEHSLFQNMLMFLKMFFYMNFNPNQTTFKKFYVFLILFIVMIFYCFELFLYSEAEYFSEYSVT